MMKGELPSQFQLSCRGQQVFLQDFSVFFSIYFHFYPAKCLSPCWWETISWNFPFPSCHIYMKVYIFNLNVSSEMKMVRVNNFDRIRCTTRFDWQWMHFPEISLPWSPLFFFFCWSCYSRLYSRSNVNSMSFRASQIYLFKLSADIQSLLPVKITAKRISFIMRSEHEPNIHLMALYKLMRAHYPSTSGVHTDWYNSKTTDRIVCTVEPKNARVLQTNSKLRALSTFVGVLIVDDI